MNKPWAPLGWKRCLPEYPSWHQGRCAERMTCCYTRCLMLWSSLARKLRKGPCSYLWSFLWQSMNCTACQFKEWPASSLWYECPCRCAVGHVGIGCGWAHILFFVAEKPGSELLRGGTESAEDSTREKEVLILYKLLSQRTPQGLRLGLRHFSIWGLRGYTIATRGNASITYGWLGLCDPFLTEGVTLH